MTLQRRRSGGPLARRPGRRRTGPGSTRRPLDSWIAHRREWRRHGLHGQVRAGPGDLHRPDAADRRGAVGADGARHARAVRHRPDARPGHDLRQPVPSGQLQPGQPGAGRRHRPRGAPPSAPRTGWACPSTSSTVDDGVVAVRGEPRSRRELRGRSSAARRFDLPLDRDRHGEGARRLDACSARPCRGSTSPPWSPDASSSCTTSACPGMLHGARGAAASRRRHSSCSVDESSVRSCPACVQVVVKQRLRRDRRREAVAGPPGGRAAEGRLDAGHDAAEPGDLLRAPADAEAGSRHAGRGLRRRGREAGRGRNDRGGDLSASLSDARIDRAPRAPSPTSATARPRSGRRPRPSTRSQSTTAMVLGLPAGEGARHLHARIGLLRHQRCRHRVLRRGAAVPGRGTTGPRAALATRTRWRGRTTATPT